MIERVSAFPYPQHIIFTYYWSIIWYFCNQFLINYISDGSLASYKLIYDCVYQYLKWYFNGYSIESDREICYIHLLSNGSICSLLLQWQTYFTSYCTCNSFILTLQFLHRFVKIDLLFHTFMSKYTYPTNVRNFDVI